MDPPPSAARDPDEDALSRHVDALGRMLGEVLREQEGEAGPLPDFLADEAEGENASDDDPQQLDAAE